MGTLVIPNTFVPDTDADATQVNANFDAIVAIVNGQIDSTNINSAAGITLSQLFLSGPAFNKTTSGTRTWASGLLTDTVPQVAMYSDQGLQFGIGGVVAMDVKLQRTASNTLKLSPPTSGLLLSDTFTGSASTNLTAHTANSGNSYTSLLGTIELDGAGFIWGNSAVAVNKASGTFGANTQVQLQFTVDCVSDIQFAGAGFVDNSGNTYYLTSLNSGSSGGGWEVRKYASGGASTTLASLHSTPLTPGLTYNVAFNLSTDGATVTMAWSVGQAGSLIWSSTITDSTYPNVNSIAFQFTGATSTVTGHHIGTTIVNYGGGATFDLASGTLSNPNVINMFSASSILNMNGGSITNAATIVYSGSPTFPATGIKFSTANLTTVVPAAPGQVTVITIPDPGAGTANFVLDKGASTIQGVRTFSSVPIVPTGGITFNTANKLTLLPISVGQVTALGIADPGAVTGYVWTFQAPQSTTGKLSLTDFAVATAVKYRQGMAATLRNIDGTVLDATGGSGKYRISVPSFGGGTQGVVLVSEIANGNTKIDAVMFEFLVPQNYVAGSAISVIVQNQVIIGLGTLGSNSLQVDVYKIDQFGAAGSNLSSGSQSLSTSSVALTYTVTPTGIVPGDKLFIQIQASFQETAAQNIQHDIQDVSVSLNTQG
jgi:hypothetical protein